MTDKIALKKVLHAFHGQANRLMRARYDTFTSELSRFLNFVDNEPLIRGYIDNCISNHLPEGFDADAEVEEVHKSHGTIFTFFGNNEEEETAETYLILRSMVEKNISGRDTFFFGYGGGSNTYQDMVKDFLNRIVYHLINNISGFLSRLGLEMGLDERTSHVTSISNSPNAQVNNAFDRSNLSATQNNDLKVDELKSLLSALVQNAESLSSDDREVVQHSARALEEEIVSDSPKKGVVKHFLNTLKGINGSAQFGAALTQIISFLSPIL